MSRGSNSFEIACQDAVGSLRAALVALFDSVGVDPSAPQDVSRRYRLNKTLTWNISRLLQATDSISAVPHVPGTQALEKMLQATSADGASSEAVQRVRSASRAFDEIVEVHVGDRTTLDLVLDSMGGAPGGGLELSRKLAYRGNSGLYGVQAKTRVMSWFLSPNKEDPARLDMGMVAGYIGLRRLRASVRWPIFKVRAWATTDQPITTPRWIPLEPGAGGNAMSLMPSYSSVDASEIQVVESDEGLDCHLMPGKIGNVGSFDCLRGETMLAAANRYQEDNDDSTGEFGAAITTPSEALLFDFIVHRELEFALNPEALIFSKISSMGEQTPASDDASVLPIQCRMIDLPGDPPAVATPMMPRYTEIADLVASRLGRDLREFRAKRIILDYPPLDSHVVMRFQLPLRGE